MTDIEKPEGSSVEKEQPAPSVLDVSDTTDTTTLVSDAITEERVSELLDEKLATFTESQQEILKQIAEREVQSKHDSRYGRFETKLDELLAIKERIETNDGSWDDVLAQIERQEGTAQLEATLDAKIEQALTSVRPAMDDGGPKDQRIAEWNEEWKQAVQNVTDKAATDELEIPAEALEQVRSGSFKTKIDAYTALNDLYIAVKTGAEIPAAATQTEEGGDAPPISDPKTSPDDDYDTAMNALQTAIQNHGAGSRHAQEAKANADKVLAKAYEKHDVAFVPRSAPKT